MNQARDAHAFLDAVIALHRALVTAAYVPVLDAMHQAIVAALRSTLAKATFIDGYEPLLRHSIGVHQGIAEAISSRNRAASHKVMLVHTTTSSAETIRAARPGHRRNDAAPENRG